MYLELLMLPLAYLFGSISSAVLVCRLMRLPDPRTEGSNNPGATNVFRIGGKRAAALTLAGDSLKGFIPVFMSLLLGFSPLFLGLVAMAAFLGHLYPIFFGFKGGKGVATALGVQFGLSWMVGGGVALIWLFVAKVLKISSLAALTAMALAPLLVWLVLESLELVVMQVVMSALLFWRHRSNIRNLLQGTEERISGRTPDE